MTQDDFSDSDSIATPSSTASDHPVDEANASPDPTPRSEPRIDDADLDAAKAAWEVVDGSDESESATLSDQEIQRTAELAEPFIGQWNKLISTTNWEKGRIISEWRRKLMESGVDATQYSDEAWSRRVGGVTAPHVGRLRRVYERFHESYASYDGLYWSHFLAALDWQDAPMWLEGAAGEGWSISAMREKRWQAEGAVDSKRPTDSQIVSVDLDEDITEPAQGDSQRREYDNDGSGVAGPTFEGPDFGDEEELQSLAGQNPDGAAASRSEDDEEATADKPVQPFRGLPPLPDDLNDAVEALKLSVLRHKATEWRDVDLETIDRYLEAVRIMIRS